MTILYEIDPPSAETLRSALGGTTAVVDGLAGLRRLLEVEGAHELLVIGPGVDDQVAMDVATGERLAHPALGVILVRRRVDSAVLRDAMRAGFREVVKSDDMTALLDACSRSLELSQAFRGTRSTAASSAAVGQLVTVFAAKGGCGKTTVSTNLAASLAVSGQSVCLLDLDLAFGDVAIAMQLFPARTLSDAVGLARLDETAVRSLVTPHSKGLDTIVAPVEPGAAEFIPGHLIGDLLAVLKTMYDVVVVDTPPAFTDHVLAAFDQTDHLVLLATLDVPAVKNLKLTLETLELLNFPRERCHVVLNRSDSKVGLSVADVEKTLKATIVAQVPSSRAVPASINRGVPIVLDQPGHPVSVALRKFADAHLASKPQLNADLRREKRGFPRRRRPEHTS